MVQSGLIDREGRLTKDFGGEVDRAQLVQQKASG